MCFTNRINGIQMSNERWSVIGSYWLKQWHLLILVYYINKNNKKLIFLIIILSLYCQ